MKRKHVILIILCSLLIITTICAALRVYTLSNRVEQLLSNNIHSAVSYLRKYEDSQDYIYMYYASGELLAFIHNFEAFYREQDMTSYLLALNAIAYDMIADPTTTSCFTDQMIDAIQSLESDYMNQSSYLQLNSIHNAINNVT